ncbi:MAG: SprT family zinc-dependent metalloprotease [Candidatus Stygibacter frigidus]|nr:SprT family zinc-dependent metalloprotease [Candidatus Stygibacter frigidus]
MIRDELSQAGLHLIIKRKKVKHINLHFDNSNILQISVPISTTEQRIDEALQIKRDWIFKCQKILLEKDSRVKIKPDIFILMGEEYQIEYDPTLINSCKFDYINKKVINSFKIVSDSQRAHIYKIYAKEYLIPLTFQYAQRMGFKINKVSIRGQKTLWGTCSHSGNISLNWKLILTPEFVIDYLIYHELLHTRHHNHGKIYKKELRQLYPRTDEAELWLKQHSQLLKLY